MRMVIDKEVPLAETEHFSDTAPDYSPLMKCKLGTSGIFADDIAMDASGGDCRVTRLQRKRANYAHPSPNGFPDDEDAAPRTPFRTVVV